MARNRIYVGLLIPFEDRRHAFISGIILGIA